MHLLRVVDLPEEGLPTMPMRGSRGIDITSDLCLWFKIYNLNSNRKDLKRIS